MQKFELLSIKCKMCDWQWEMTPFEKPDEIICEHCGSQDFHITKKNLHMFKKNGKFVTDIGFAHPRDEFGAIPVDEIMEQNEEPLLVVKENDIKISEKINNEDMKRLLSKVNSIRNKILDEMEIDHQELLNRLNNS